MLVADGPQSSIRSQIDTAEPGFVRTNQGRSTRIATHVSSLCPQGQDPWEATRTLLGADVEPYSLHVISPKDPSLVISAAVLSPDKDGYLSGYIIHKEKYGTRKDLAAACDKEFVNIPTAWCDTFSKVLGEATDETRLGAGEVSSLLSYFSIILLGDAAYGLQFYSPTLVNGALEDARTLNRVIGKVTSSVLSKLAGNDEVSYTYNMERRDETLAQISFEQAAYEDFIAGSDGTVRSVFAYIYKFDNNTREALRE